MPYYQDDEAAGYTRRSSRRSQDSPMPMEMDPIFDMDVLMSEFSDTLFSTLSSHQPIPWPNPREIGKFLHMMDMGYNNINKVLYLVTICCFSQHMQVMQTWSSLDSSRCSPTWTSWTHSSLFKVKSYHINLSHSLGCFFFLFVDGGSTRIELAVVSMNCSCLPCSWNCGVTVVSCWVKSHQSMITGFGCVVCCFLIMADNQLYDLSFII